MRIPKIGEKLDNEQIVFLKAFAKACRRSIVEMVVNADSGHPGGSLSTIDYLSVLYAFVLSQTGEKIVISNGHISPAVYSVLGEMGYVDKSDAVKNFRRAGSKFEGHVTRHVNGVWYGTGPLGTGISAAAGFAVAERVKAKAEGRPAEKVFGIVGDGEAQEGQVYEMMNFASKYKLNNFIVFMDFNRVQLTDSLEKIMPLQAKAHFEAAGWNVIDVDGHDHSAIWSALAEAYATEGRPVLLLGHTIMGKGAGEMEKDGLEYKATWHGKSPGVELGGQVVRDVLTLTDEESDILKSGMDSIHGSGNFWKPEPASFPKHGDKVSGQKIGSTVMAAVDIGASKIYGIEEKTDCRSAYGNALKELGERNKNILVFDADLQDSVKTGAFHKSNPERFFQCGIAEQHMVSASGGASLDGMISFCSTFGAFMTSRAKDQARVNDINEANVKMVSTHCGLSVGEDGPTHQAIDDMGAFRPFFNTVVLEPADPNQCDKMIRHIASHFGNYYVRMGRHKLPTLTKTDGSVFYDAGYVFTEGKFDLYREGKDITLIASGPMVCVAEAVMSELRTASPSVSVEIIIANSPTKLDKELIVNSVKKTGRLITLEDHNPYTGIGSQIVSMLAEEGLVANDGTALQIKRMGVTKYQLSGTPEELYVSAGLGSADIKLEILNMMRS